MYYTTAEADARHRARLKDDYRRAESELKPSSVRALVNSVVAVVGVIGALTCIMLLSRWPNTLSETWIWILFAGCLVSSNVMAHFLIAYGRGIGAQRALLQWQYSLHRAGITVAADHDPLAHRGSVIDADTHTDTAADVASMASRPEIEGKPDGADR